MERHATAITLRSDRGPFRLREKEYQSMDDTKPDFFRSHIFTLKRTIAATVIAAPIAASATSETLKVCPSGCEFSSIQSALDRGIRR